MLPSYANLLALAAFGSLVVGNPLSMYPCGHDGMFRTLTLTPCLDHIEIQEVIKAVFEDVSTSQNSGEHPYLMDAKKSTDIWKLLSHEQRSLRTGPDFPHHNYLECACSHERGLLLVGHCTLL